MPLTVLAAHPQATARTLEILTAHACAAPAQRHLLLLALASNPHLPPDQLAQILTCAPQGGWRALLGRPGTTVADVCALLGPLNDAGQVYEAFTWPGDVNDVIGRTVVARYPSATTASQALVSARTHDWSLAAACVLAGAPERDWRHGTQLLHWARQNVHHLPALLAATPPGQLHRDLEQVATSAGDPQMPGTRAWLTSPATATADIIDCLAGAPAKTWAAAVSDAHDPHFVLARAAYHSPRPAGTDVVLRAILERDGLPTDLRCAAARELLAQEHGAGTALGPRARNPLLTGPDDIACAYLSTAWNLDHVDHLRTLDVAAPVVTSAISTLDTLFSREAARGPVSAHRSRALWGVWLATQLNATPDQRQLGARWAADHTHPAAGRTAAGQGLASYLPLFAHVAAVAADPRPDSSALLPVDALRSAYTMSVPGVRRLAASALDRALPEMTEPAIRALVAISPAFTGTLRELFATATSLALPLVGRPGK